MAELQLGNYQLRERIGRGGMSDVYRGIPLDGGADVAVKVLRLDDDNAENTVFVARFEREARIIAELHHEHILSIVDYGQEDDTVFFVTPLIEGGTLADLIRQRKLDPEFALHWLNQVASALDHAHRMGVIHRDLKPTNVLIDDDNHAYLTDFGIAKLTNHTSGLTQTGNVIGTPAYMAPEQWRDELLDARTDVYGLGVMTFIMLTQKTPFRAESAHAMMYQHLDQPAPSLLLDEPSIPLAVDAVVLKALAKDPESRYATAGAFAADFAAALAGHSTQAALATDPTPQHNPRAAVASPLPIPIPSSGMMPRPSYPIPDHLRRGRSGKWSRLWWGIGGAAALLMVLVGLGVAFLFAFSGDDADAGGVAPFLDLDSGSDDSINDLVDRANETENLIPTPQTTPNERPIDVPRVRIVAPMGDLVIPLGDEIVIEIEAFDNQGVTRVELRRFGVVLDAAQSANPTQGEARLDAILAYTPETRGVLRLEVVPYRGDLAGESRFISVVVQ